MKTRELRPAVPITCRLGPLNLLFLAALAICCSGCKPSVGGIYPGPMRDPRVTVPASAVGGGSGTFTVEFTGGVGPYNVHYEFSGCVDPLEQAQFRNEPGDSLTVTFLPTQTAQSCTLTVKVVDSWGLTATSAPVGFTVQPGGSPPPPPEIIAGVVSNNAACTVAVTVADPDGDDVTVSAIPPEGMSVANSPQTVVGGNGTVTIQFYALDPLTGVTGTINITATAGTTVDIATTQLDCAPITLAPDTLYAIPLRPSVLVDEPVRIMVAMGDPANPFQYLNSVRVCAPVGSGFHMENGNSLDYGAPGGGATEVDGVWAQIGTDSFLLGPDIVWWESINLGDGRIGISFNVTPLGAEDSELVSGLLFSFEAVFTEPGVWPLTFQAQTGEGISRTYYQDSTQTTDFFWGDISNEVNGEQLSVEVLP